MPDAATEYTGPAADAKAAEIEQTLGTDDEKLVEVFWLLRYTTAKHGIQWPTVAQILAERGKDNA